MNLRPVGMLAIVMLTMLALITQPCAAGSGVYAGPATKLSGKLAEGTATDIEMRNSKLSMIIAVTFEDPQLPAATLGKPVDMAVPGQNDGIDWMNMPVLSLEEPIFDGSGGLTTVQYQKVGVVRVTDDEAVVEAEGIYTEVPGVTVRTTYSIKPDQEWVYAVTTIHNPAKEDLQVWAADVMDNDDGKQYVFVPGVGDIGPGTKGRSPYTPTAPWIGHYGNAAQGYAFVYDNSFDGFIQFGANITVMTMKQITVPAGGSYEIRRYIVVVPTEGYKHKMDAVAEIYEKIRAQW